MSKIKFLLGDKNLTVHPDDVTPETTLNAYLRDINHLTGTKRMCLEGGCGCCIVAVEEIDPFTKKKRVFAVNSCLVSIFSCHGMKIHTIEGIGGPTTRFNAIQKSLAEGSGTQCGFCSPGMVMNMYALTQSGQLSKERIENSFGGNICRCTGYRPILETFRKFATTDIEDYTPCQQNCEGCPRTNLTNQLTVLYDVQKTSWMKLYNLDDLLLTLSNMEGSYKLVAGNTARGVYKNDPLPSTYIDITSVIELRSWKIQGPNLILGGNVTLNDAINIFQSISKQNTKFSYLSKLAKHIDLVANLPVRNIGTLAGNLMIKYIHPDFPSDIFLILETVAATLIIVDPTGEEFDVKPKKFLKLDMKKRVIKSIVLPEYDDKYTYRSYKIMHRAQNVHAAVNAGFLLKLKNNFVVQATIVYGNINTEFVHAESTEKYLKNKNIFDNSVLQQAFASLDREIKTDYRPPDDGPEYRKQLAICLFYKFVLSIAPKEKISTKYQSGGFLLKRPLSKGTQEYSTKKDMYPVSEPVIKLESLVQSSGQAKYIEDMPDYPGQLFIQFVVAKAPANSVITKIDTSKALSIPNVVAFYGKQDIPGENNFTPSMAWNLFAFKEEVFCSGTVQYYDQPVGIIVAKSQEVADKAAEIVKVNCTPPISEPLLVIKDVLKAPADVQKKKIKHLTDLVAKRKGNSIKKVIKGEFYVGPQYHFHMEVQCCAVIPVEDGLDVHSSTQWIDGTQLGVANVLNIPANKVNMQVRRLGGAFGAKITRNTLPSVAAALAAYKLNQPVKMRLSLEKNMEIIGKRYPCYVKYEVGVNEKGVIQYLNADIYSDFGIGGNEAMFLFLLDCFQSGYLSDTWNVSLYQVHTDTHANCFARAPGTTEGFAAIEAIMEHIASSLNLDSYDLKKANFDLTKYPKIQDYYTEILTWANINQRKQSIKTFNNNNRWKKRGMSISPLVWTLEVTGNFSVFVSIFHGDGSVAVAHGGIEMGQGINTKVAQVCAYKLGIPLNMVSVKPTNTLTNANCFITGGSVTSEAVCWSTIKSCQILLDRMKPVRDQMTNPSWKDLVAKCFDKNVLLSANSLWYANASKEIVPYPIYAVGAVEVEVDILTGQHQVIQVDIIEDVGDSISPVIDIGQVEGAFVMGMGYYTTEKLVYDEKGKLLTNRTWNYYPPGAKDIPQNLNIKFPGNNPNPVGTLHSKAIGEPPLCLSVAVPLAIRNAVGLARKDGDLTKEAWYPFDGCSTIENTFLNSLNNYKMYSL
ncbi:unnamed protein product [Brassicogethes aeneus]|uniref:Indole-3-acetaldehyde oxidase n=1 Tax=Brassicogethes aeneus TaxID=1431903 RepID=A0A9P0AXW6_BRAAE|nr:unnamed protein product [Brassicogethes aeneus]